MAEHTFEYDDGNAVCLGDVVFLRPEGHAIVTKILQPFSDESIQWGYPSGGVILDCVSNNRYVGCRYMIRDFDEDYELIMRNLYFCSPYVSSEFNGGDLHGLEIEHIDFK